MCYPGKSTKMKYILKAFLFLTMLIPISSHAQNRTINFIEKPWAEILWQANAENKMIFMDAYTSWCGPCKWMAANMFTNDVIADYYNKTFICAHFDMEKGEGVQLSQYYQVRAYPTLLFIDKTGAMVHKRVGAPQKVQDYLDMGNTALTPGEGFSAYEKKFKAGNRDPKFMIIYLDRLQGAYMPINEPIKEYFASQKESDLLNRPNWEIIYQFTSDMDSPEFIYLIKHQKEFEKQYTRDSVSTKIFNVYLQSLIAVSRSRSGTEETIGLVKQKIRDSGFAGADKVIFTAELSSSSGDKFLEAAFSGIDKWYLTDYDMLNRISKAFLQNAQDVKYLGKAADWAKASMRLKSTAENNDLYASLMFKLGNKPEAVKYEKTAIELAVKSNVSPKPYEDNLRKFEEK